jgi:hypothetical protein
MVPEKSQIASKNSSGSVKLQSTSALFIRPNKEKFDGAISGCRVEVAHAEDYSQREKSEDPSEVNPTVVQMNKGLSPAWESLWVSSII